MEKLFLFGCGGIGCELAAYYSENEGADVVFVDDNESIREMYGFPVYTLDRALELFPIRESGITTTIGEPAIREAITARLTALEIPERTLDLGLYHSAGTVTIGKGTILHIGSILTVRTNVGKSCLINKGAVIGHDCTIGDHCVISPNATVGGSVCVGSGTFIGVGAVLRNNISIGKNVIIGMGSVVTKDVADGVVVVGNPGRVIRENRSRRVF